MSLEGAVSAYTRLTLTDHAGAVFDPDRVYRYLLWREWDNPYPDQHGETPITVALGPKAPSVCFVMLNPSTADESDDDPTLRKCIGFVRRWGYKRLEVVNLFALRATDPRELRKHADPVGPLNTPAIAESVLRCSLVVCAWGAHRLCSYRSWFVTENQLRPQHPSLWAVGLNIAGDPRHPLYAKYTDAPVLYRGAGTWRRP